MLCANLKTTGEELFISGNRQVPFREWLMLTGSLPSEKSGEEESTSAASRTERIPAEFSAAAERDPAETDGRWLRSSAPNRMTIRQGCDRCRLLQRQGMQVRMKGTGGVPAKAVSVRVR